MKAILSGVSKSYRLGWRRPPFQALKNVSFGIEAGSITGLVGPNGSGKSTSIKILLGLMFPDSGDVQLLGCSPRDRKAFRNIGYVAENVSFSGALKPLEILDYHGRVHGLDAATRKQRSGGLLEEVGLGGHANKTVSQFSKGMVQRLALAVSLVNDPELLILDEPVSGLDPIGHRFVLDLLSEQHKQGKTICFSSHQLHDVDELCDRLVVIYKGDLIYQGEKDKFVRHTGMYQLTYDTHQASAPVEIPDAMAVGKNTWRVVGPPEELMRHLQTLQNANAEILSYGRESSTLETSFLEMVQNG